MENTLKGTLEEIQNANKAIKSALEKLPISNKYIRRIRLELMKALFDLRDATEQIYEVEPILQPEGFDPNKEEYIISRQSEARKLELEGQKEEAAKIYKELMEDPKAQFIKESFEAGLYRCNK